MSAELQKERSMDDEHNDILQQLFGSDIQIDLNAEFAALELAGKALFEENAYLVAVGEAITSNFNFVTAFEKLDLWIKSTEMTTMVNAIHTTKQEFFVQFTEQNYKDYVNMLMTMGSGRSSNK